MKFLEKDLEEVIQLSTKKQLENAGLLHLKGICKRQLKIGNYGIADLIYFDRVYERNYTYLRINVCELKKDKAGISAFLQAVRYCKGIKSYLLQRKPNLLFYFNIYLIGNEIDTNSDYIFLTDLIDNYFLDYSVGNLKNIYNYSYDYKIDGLKFKMHKNYTLTEEKFKL